MIDPEPTEEEIEAQREREREDLLVDDEINRARERRHFEPDHFGT